MLFTEIYELFFQGHKDYYIQYYDDKGEFKLSSRGCSAVSMPLDGSYCLKPLS